MSELLGSLPAPVTREKGLLESISKMGVRDASRPAPAAVSAARLLLNERRLEAAEADSPAVVIAASTPKPADPSNPLHDAIVAGHRANMDEIQSRQKQVAGSRAKSSRANKKNKKGAEKGQAYNDRLTSKNGNHEKRTQRMKLFARKY